MAISVGNLDRMPRATVSELLRSCCGSSRWVAGMVARRPFGSREALLSAADEVWRALDPEDWLEAFSHHPRIGKQKTVEPQLQRAAAWSNSEQEGVERSTADVRDAIAAANRDYERRFGYIYIVCASGRSADEMLSMERERLKNSPDEEVATAAEEQRKITQLRLVKLLDEGETA